MVHLSLPKFDVSYSKNIAEDLQQLGIKNAFDADISDFTPIVTDVPTELSSVDHAARVRIDENGCEAAAYTAIISSGTSIPEDEAEIIFDRPFIFVITGTDSLPRFIGIVNNI